MSKESDFKSSEIYSRIMDSNQETSKPSFFERMMLKWNGGHQLLATTDSPTISTCTTSTNLTNCEFQSSSTINKYITAANLEKNLRNIIVEIEPLQKQTKTDMINDSQQNNEISNKQQRSSETATACFLLKNFRLCLHQILTAIAVSFVSMVIGYVSGYTSPAELSLKKDLEITNFHFSWISGSMPLAAVFGGLMGGPMIEKLGRKWTILVTDILFLGGWALNYWATSFHFLYVSRTISGCAVGIASLTLPVYLGETIQPEVRGTLGLLPTAFGNIGILLSFSMGFFLKWQGIAGVGALLTIPFLLFVWIIPETPRWYVSKGKTDESHEALLWLRGNVEDDAVKKEFEDLLKTQKVSDEKTELRDLFTRPNKKSLLIVLGLMFFQQLSGINAIIFYTTQIFEDTGSDIPSSIQTIIVGAVNFAATFIATLLIDKLGRKILLYISSIAMIITLAVLSAYFFVLQSNVMDISSYGWIPLASFVVYVLGFSLGFGPIPWLMMGEILPAKIRGPAASVSTGFNWICTFVVTTAFHLIKDIIGAGGVFMLFCVVCVVGLVFVILVVPETKGESLEDIERKLAGVKVRRMSSIANMKPLPSGV